MIIIDPLEDGHHECDPLLGHFSLGMFFLGETILDQINLAICRLSVPSMAEQEALVEATQAVEEEILQVPWLILLGFVWEYLKHKTVFPNQRSKHEAASPVAETAANEAVDVQAGDVVSKEGVET